MKLRFPAACILIAAILTFAVRVNAAMDPAWTTAHPPFRIAGNLYYVGSGDLAAYLITTPKGDILINSNLESSPPQIKRSVEALGLHFSDIKVLLISHGHYDHCAGSAQILKTTAAKYMVMDADVPVVESGGRNDFHYAQSKDMWFPPAHVDRVLHDGDIVRLADTVLTAHKTAGHTKGTTTWTMDVQEKGKVLHVVIVGSPNVNPGYKLAGNTKYPQIARDYAHGFDVLQKLPCDVFLGAHGAYFELQEKYRRWQQGDHDAFIDPAGYQRYIADRKEAFETELKRQSAPNK